MNCAQAHFELSNFELIHNLITQNRQRRPTQNSKFKTGGLAQLARAPALQAGGQRFESVILHLVNEKGKTKREKSNGFFTLHF